MRVIQILNVFDPGAHRHIGKARGIETGTGHIRKRGKRSWAVVVDLGHDPLTGKRQRQWRSVKGTNKDPKMARRALRADKGMAKIHAAKGRWEFTVAQAKKAQAFLSA